MTEGHLTPLIAASQHGPRPLPLFLTLLRNETAAFPGRRQAALAGLKAYQQAERGPARQMPDAIAQAGRARLLDYGGAGPPVIFVPSLINPPFILDLAGDNSMLRWLAQQGVRPLLVDWGTPGPEAHAQGIDYHVEHMLLPLIDALGEPPLLVGYCLGGTLALAAAVLRPVRGIATIAAPWRFARYGEKSRAAVADQWRAARPTCDNLGLVPMEVLQAGFWQLDAASTIAKFEKFGTLAPDSPAAHAFVALEDWANAGAPLTFAAGEDIFSRFYARDLPGTGRWWIAGTRIVPKRLACPTVEFLSATDRIAPPETAIGFADQRLVHAGHVGMVVGRRGRTTLWQPLRDWLIAAVHTNP